MSAARASNRSSVLMSAPNALSNTAQMALWASMVSDSTWSGHVDCCQAGLNSLSPKRQIEFHEEWGLCNEAEHTNRAVADAAHDCMRLLLAADSGLLQASGSCTARAGWEAEARLRRLSSSADAWWASSSHCPCMRHDLYWAGAHGV